MALRRTSKEAKEILEAFRRSTGIRPNLWARAALGYSLSLAAEPESAELDSEGTEFQEKVFYGGDEETLMALIRQRLGRTPAADEITGIVKAHVERGLRHFHDEYNRLNRRGDELLFHLLGKCAIGDSPAVAVAQQLLPDAPKTDGFEVRLKLGKESKGTNEVTHLLNGPGGAPHIAIMGRNGTGKTRTGLSLLQHVRAMASYSIPFLIFDYAKGDIAANKKFVQAINAEVVSLPGERIPIAPLSIPVRDSHAVQLAARRFRDTICSVVPIGAIQKDRCLQLTTRAYNDFADRSPDLDELFQIAEQEYNTSGLREDSLLACFRDFSSFPLFRSATVSPTHDLFRKSHVIDIHRLPEDLRKLSVFLLLDRLYSEIMSMPDAPLDKSGNRQLRLIIVIDEAHHFLPCKQQTLENMIREVRSKGVGLWMFSQSPDDFDQTRYNFAREMGLSIVFSCVLEKPKMLEAVLGAKVDPRRLSQLAPGVAITRVQGADTPTEVVAWTA
jgi:DNA sulfur modification protein DndE